MSRRALLLIALAASLAACTSPESTRTRGPGADKGNRGEVVLMHEGSKPYAGTPAVISADPPPLETANHAHVLSTER